MNQSFYQYIFVKKIKLKKIYGYKFSGTQARPSEGARQT